VGGNLDLRCDGRGAISGKVVGAGQVVAGVFCLVFLLDIA